MSNLVVRVGDTVLWKGCFGMDAEREVEVTGMEVTEYPRDKGGFQANEVREVPWSLVLENKVIFTLSTGNWAYSEQIRPARFAISRPSLT